VAAHQTFCTRTLASVATAGEGASALTPSRIKRLEDIGFEWVSCVLVASLSSCRVELVISCNVIAPLLILLHFCLEQSTTNPHHTPWEDRYHELVKFVVSGWVLTTESAIEDFRLRSLTLF
jgi:hypothetical protein